MIGKRTWRGLLSLCTLVLALPAGAAEPGVSDLVDVRIGRHPGFTRVVLETDRESYHHVERAGPQEIVVYVAAVASEREVPPRVTAQLRTVEIEGFARASKVRLRLEGAVELRTMVLQRPPRIVLDLYDAAVPAL